MSETWLTPSEVETLTGKVRWKAQCKVLAGMGVPFIVNGAGRPLVERSLVLREKPKAKRVTEPNWNAIRGKAA